MTDNRRIEHTILVSGYFGGDGHEKKLRYFEKLDRVLRRWRYRIAFIDLSPVRAVTTCPVEQVPAFIREAHKIRGARYLAESDVSPALLHAAALEAENRNAPLLDSCVKALFFRAWLRGVVRKYQPRQVVLWHQFNLFHRAAQDLCGELGLPCVFAEYGVLPGTAVLEREGQMAESRVAREPDCFLQLPVADDDLARAEVYLDFVRAQKLTRKEQKSELDVTPIVARAREKGRRVIFYAGQQDYASGMLPSWLPEARLHSPVFIDTIDALRYLSRLAERNDWQILFKPHPILAERKKAIEVPHSDRVDVVQGANLFECMEQSDVTTTILSQVSYMALVHHRPCVLLGRNQLSGKGCVYEAASIDGVEGQFRAALQHGFTAEQRAAWRRHVAQLARHYVFGLEDEVTALLQRDAEDAARYLVKCAEYPSEARPDAVANRRWGGDLAAPEDLLALRLRYIAGKYVEPLLGPLRNALRPAKKKS